MRAHPESRLQGLALVLLGTVALMLLGAIPLFSGLSALDAGELWVGSARRGTTLRLNPAEHPWAFYLEVWGRVVIGALLIALGPLVLGYLLFMPKSKRDARLRAASAPGRTASGPKVPWWMALLVILGVLALLAVGASRQSSL